MRLDRAQSVEHDNRTETSVIHRFRKRVFVFNLVTMYCAFVDFTHEVHYKNDLIFSRF